MELLDKEIESWKGFPWTLRKDNLEPWSVMIKEVRDDFVEAVEKSGKMFTTDPFFMALPLARQRMISRLQDELKAVGAEKLPVIESCSNTILPNLLRHLQMIGKLLPLLRTLDHQGRIAHVEAILSTARILVQVRNLGTLPYAEPITV